MCPTPPSWSLSLYLSQLLTVGDGHVFGCSPMFEHVLTFYFSPSLLCLVPRLSSCLVSALSCPIGTGQELQACTLLSLSSSLALLCSPLSSA